MGCLVSPTSANSSSYVQRRFSLRSSKASDSRKAVLAMAYNTIYSHVESIGISPKFFWRVLRDCGRLDLYETFSQALAFPSQLPGHGRRRRRGPNDCPLEPPVRAKHP